MLKKKDSKLDSNLYAGLKPNSSVSLKIRDSHNSWAQYVGLISYHKKLISQKYFFSLKLKFYLSFFVLKKKKKKKITNTKQ